MSIFSRCSDILRSNINAFLDKAEDPAKMVDQLLLDARRDYAEVKDNTAKVLADEKAAKRRLDETQATVNKYAEAAKKAVKAGNDDDARELLSKKQLAEGNLPAMQQAYDLAHQNADLMRNAAKKLLDDIQQLEARKANVKAKVAAAKAQETVNKITSGTKNRRDVNSALDRLEEKANLQLDSAMAKSELEHELRNEDVLAKYSGGSAASVDDELAALKAELDTESE